MKVVGRVIGMPLAGPALGASSGAGLNVFGEQLVDCAVGDPCFDSLSGTEIVVDGTVGAAGGLGATHVGSSLATAMGSSEPVVGTITGAQTLGLGSVVRETFFERAVSTILKVITEAVVQWFS